VVEAKAHSLELLDLGEFTGEVISCIHSPEELKADSILNGLKRKLCSVTGNEREDLDGLGIGGDLFPVTQDLLVAGAGAVRVLKSIVDSSKINRACGYNGEEQREKYRNFHIRRACC